MLPNVKLNIGSIGNAFTAVAIAQLAQAGKLSCNDTIETYIPELATLSKGMMTIEQVLTHSSGLGDFWKNDGYTFLRFQFQLPMLSA
jgi:CubicO group peptidase (beta-lactamase class C family)